MRHLIAIHLLSVFFSVPAFAQDTITFPAGFFSWNAVTQETGDSDVESADDTFVINAGSEVQISGDIALTTGKIQCNGGTLIHNGPYTISISSDGGYIGVSGCNYKAQADVVWEGRIDALSWGSPSAGLTVTLPIDISAQISPKPGGSDDVFMVWPYVDAPANPAEAYPKDVAFQTDQNEKDPTKLRPNYSPGLWLRVSAASGHNLTVEYDPREDLDMIDGADDSTPTVTASPNLPYEGTYAPDASTAITPSANSVSDHGEWTALTVPTGTVASTIGNDFSDMFVEWVAGDCTGKLSKSLYTTDGGAGSDTIYVAGNARKCGTSNIIIHYGIRPHDYVKIIRPPQINGGTFGYILWNDGALQWRNMRVIRLGVVTGTTISPSILNNCSICVYQESASVEPDASNSYVVESEFAWWTSELASDEWAWFIGSETNGNLARFSTNLLDLTGFRFEDNYIHDVETEVSGTGGHHGVYCSGVIGFEPVRTRITHMTDDGFVCFATKLGASGTNPSLHIKGLIALANKAENSNSQSPLQISNRAYGNGTSHDYILSRDVRANDLLLMGGGTDSASVGLRWEGLGAIGNRMVISGENLLGGLIEMGWYRNSNVNGDCIGLNSPITTYCTGPGAGSGTLPTNSWNTYLNKFSNLILFPLGAAANRSLAIAGSLSDSVIAETNQSNNRITGAPIELNRLFATLRNNPMVLGQTADFPTLSFPTMSWTDTVMLGANTNQAIFADGSAVAIYADSTEANVSTVNWTRLYLSTVTWRTSGTPDSIVQGSFTGDTDPTLNIAGLTMTSSSSYTGGLGDGDTDEPNIDGADMTDVCIETTADPDDPDAGFGLNRTATSLHVSSIGPDADEKTTIHAFIGSNDDDDICERARPRVLGLSEVGLVNVLLGDLHLEQLEDVWTTRDLIRGGDGRGTISVRNGG